MATGYTAIFITPGHDVMAIPEGWNTDYASDALPTAKTIYDDTFTDFDHDPTPAEVVAALGANEVETERRQVGETLWRLRRRYPVTITTETRGGIARIYELSDPKLPLSWGRKAVWWWVNSSAAKLKLLHTHINVTLGFGPVAGALAALDPANQSQFLPNAVQTATSLTIPQQLTRVTAMRNALAALGYAASNLTAIVNVPAGKTEDDSIRALVADLGFTMDKLFQTRIG